MEKPIGQQLRYPLDTVSEQIIKDIIKREIGLIPEAESGLVLVEKGSFTSSVTIDELTGDSDGIYKLLIGCYHSSAFEIALQFNADSGANYNQMQLYDMADGTIDDNNATALTSIPLYYITRKKYIIDLAIYPKSGKTRMVVGNNHGYDDTTNQELVHLAGTWTNTADELVSIYIGLSSAITGGDYALYKTNA